MAKKVVKKSAKKAPKKVVKKTSSKAKSNKPKKEVKKKVAKKTNSKTRLKSVRNSKVVAALVPPIIFGVGGGASSAFHSKSGNSELNWGCQGECNASKGFNNSSASIYCRGLNGIISDDIGSSDTNFAHNTNRITVNETVYLRGGQGPNGALCYGFRSINFGISITKKPGTFPKKWKVSATFNFTGGTERPLSIIIKDSKGNIVANKSIQRGKSSTITLFSATSGNYSVSIDVYSGNIRWANIGGNNYARMGATDTEIIFSYV